MNGVDSTFASNLTIDVTVNRNLHYKQEHHKFNYYWRAIGRLLTNAHNPYGCGVDIDNYPK